MFRNLFICAITMILALSCAHPEKRSARYDQNACPVCSNITDGTCSYCSGSSHCMYCKGHKERKTFSPNIMENSAIKKFDYSEPCQFCKNSGICTYCNATGKCWACEGTGKVAGEWKCLNSKQVSSK